MGALVALTAPPAPAQEPTPQEPSFRATSSELVVLPVVVTDKQGAFVADVARERFSVFDNGRPMPIEIFTNQDAPVTVGLIIDASSSMRTKMAEVQAAALAFARSSNPEDELFALRFNDDVRDAVPGRQQLLAEDVEALGSAIGALKPDGQTALYDALLEGLDRLDSATRARKALIVVSDGGDNASQAKLADVLTRARRSNAAIYTVGLFERDDDDRNPGRAQVARRSDAAASASCRSRQGNCCAPASRLPTRFAAVTPSATYRPTRTARSTACGWRSNRARVR